MDFVQYKNKQKVLQQCFDQSKNLAHSLQLDDIEKKLGFEEKQLEKEKFTVVVVGEFSRGKSTFVNAMMGKKILPSSKEPTTNIINKIVYGENATYTLYYKDNTTKDITKKEFDHIKAQSENNRVEKLVRTARAAVDKIKNPTSNENPFSDIQYAKITYPLDFCKNNVEVVDTPGTNDLNRARIEITYEYLNQAEAAILILGADQALSKSEYTFLKERVLGNHIKDVFIVINYKDQLTPTEEQKVFQYVADHIAKLGDFSNRIFMVSSRQALLYRREKNGELLKPKEQLSLPSNFEETGFPEFESTLANFLDTEKGNAKIQKYLQFLFQHLNDIEKVIQGRSKKLDYGLVELQKELAVEKPKYEKVRQETTRLTTYLESRLRLRGKDIGQRADIYASKIKRAAMASVDDMHPGMNEKEIQELIEIAVTPVQKDLIETIDELQRNSISEEITPIINELKKTWDDMNFDMDFESFNTKEQNKSVALQFTNIDNNNNENRWTGAFISFTIAGLLGATGFGLLAAGLFGWFAGDSVTEDVSIKLKQQVREQYDNAYLGYGDSIEEEYGKVAKKICQNIKQEVNSRLDTMEHQLNILIESKKDKEEDNDAKKKLLNQQLQEIEGMRADLRRLSE